MSGEKLVYSRHAITQMFARSISADDVSEVIEEGEAIESYEGRGRPYPSRLLLGHPGGRPLRVVAADDTIGGRVIVVTVYLPDPRIWLPDWRTRRKS